MKCYAYEKLKTPFTGAIIMEGFKQEKKHEFKDCVAELGELEGEHVIWVHSKGPGNTELSYDQRRSRAEAAVKIFGVMGLWGREDTTERFYSNGYVVNVGRMH
jgi:hypothetical protein